MSFFFSSRRRHTRLQGDWSSDVCSSDLEVGRKQAEIDTHREDQLNQSRARFTHLQYGSPQDVSQDKTDKVEILGKFDYEVRHKLGTGLLNHGVRKQCGAGKKDHGPDSDVPLGIQIREDVRIETHQSKIKSNGEQGVRIIVEVEI